MKASSSLNIFLSRKNLGMSLRATKYCCQSRHSFHAVEDNHKGLHLFTKEDKKWIRLLKRRIKNKEKVSLGSQCSSRPWLLVWCTYSICSGCTCKKENFHLLGVLRVWKFDIIYLRRCDQKCYPFQTEKFQCVKERLKSAEQALDHSFGTAIKYKLYLKSIYEEKLI